MKIRLVIPECDKFNNSFFCEDSKDLDYRADLLNEAIKNNAKVDLVVTSNNFFEFNYLSKPNAINHIEKKLIPFLNKKIFNKIPLVIGFDFRSGRKTKTKSKKKKQSASINPYGGIDAVVTYLKIRKDSYVYGLIFGNLGLNRVFVMKHRLKSRISRGFLDSKTN